MSSRPPIFQMLVVGFAVLSVAFVSISTVVAVTTAAPLPAIEAPASAPVLSAPATGWSTVTVAQRFGTGHGATSIH